MAHAPDDTQLEFSSNWDIDQLYTTATTVQSTFGTGSTNLATIPTNMQTGGRAVFDAMYQIGAGGRWQQFGKLYFVFSTATNLWVYNPSGSSVTMAVRYYIYGDKVEY